MGSKPSILVDYEFCIGCSKCEIACLEEHDNDVTRIGLKVAKNGPYQSRDGSWRHNFVPLPNEWCDACSDRRAEGREPACVDACKFDAIFSGTYEGFEHLVDTKSKVLVFVP